MTPWNEHQGKNGKIAKGDVAVLIVSMTMIYGLTDYVVVMEIESLVD
jgi:hypothetical protein